MTGPRDPALDVLLSQEIERRIGALHAGAPPGDAHAALHSLKGSAAMAGYDELSLVLAQLDGRMRAGDDGARRVALDLLSSVRERLGAGLPPLATRWPEPPPGLGPSVPEARYRAEYLATMRDRLGEIDSVLASEEPPREAIERAYRSAHSMKGAAGSVGDDTTAWYCHGLEARLKSAIGDEAAAREMVTELARHRVVLALMLDQPAHALATLRAGPRAAAARTEATRPPASSPSSSWAPQPEEDGEQLLRVPATTIDDFLEQLERMDLVEDELEATADGARQIAAHLRDMRANLLEALRLIGPPRPWGAPAAALQRIETAARKLGTAAESTDRGALVCRRNAGVLHTRAGEMRQGVAALRRTSASWLFERVAHSARRLAERDDRQVQVLTNGGDVPIDRRVAERLLDPVMQLVRNAIAHGIESPAERERAGKPPIGTISLYAERLGDWLRLTVEDDGGGVNVARVRDLAVRSGAISQEIATMMHDDELLALLFAPGLTTRDGADLLSGRGVGLDLAQDVVRRLGGAIRLGSPPGSGLVATIEVPSERGLVEVLWLEAAEQQFALPVSFTGRIDVPRPGKSAIALARCLGLPASHTPPFTLELVIHGVQPIAVGVDAIGEVDEVGIRALPPLVAAAGPYSGAVLRGDGLLRLALDAALLAARAWAHVA